MLGVSAIHNRLKMLISQKCPFVDHFFIFGWNLFIQKRSYLLNKCRGNRDSRILLGVFSVGQLAAGEKATRIHENNICITFRTNLYHNFISNENQIHFTVKLFTIFTKRVGLLFSSSNFLV